VPNLIKRVKNRQRYRQQLIDEIGQLYPAAAAAGADSDLCGGRD
jgi:hypothetical protein